MIPERRRCALALIVSVLFLAGCGRPAGPQVGGPFHLMDQNGQVRDESLLKGKWTVVFFGYTFCPDVCPTTLQALGDAQDRLGPKAARLQVVFVTVDPDRDTPAQLKTYLSSTAFPKGTVGLTGTTAQVTAAAKAYHLYFQKEGTGPDYQVQHSTAAYLMDPKGRFDRVLAYGLTPDDMARQISEAMAG